MLPLLTRSDSLQHLGLFLIVGLLLFSPLLEGGTTHVAVMIIRLLIMASLGLYLFNAMMTKTLQLRRIVVGAPVLLFLGLVVGSTIYSPYTNQSAQWLMVCLCYAALLYVVVVFLERWEDAARLRFVLIGMALAQATLVFGQVIILGIGRPTGTFFNPNFLASYLATAAILLLAIICYAKNELWRRRSWTSWSALSRPVLLFGGLSILMLAIFLTGSRGGGLALIAGTTVVIWSRYGKRGLLGLSVFVIIAVLVPNPIRDRVMTEHIYNPAAYARWQMWESALREIFDHPFGIGIGLYQYTSPQYAFPLEKEIVRYGNIAKMTHSEYLQIAVELGIIGLGVFIWGLVRVAREALWLLRQRLTRSQRALAVGTCGAVVVILTQAAFDSNFHEPALAILLTVFVGLICSGRALSCKNIQPLWTITVGRPLVWAALAAVVVGLLAANAIRLGLAYQAYELGNLLAKQQETEQAIGSFQRAIVLDPGKSLYHNSLAAAYFQLYHRSHDQMMVRASIEELRTAIALNPLDGRLHALLGYVSASQVSSPTQASGSEEDHLWLERAVEAYERAADLEPFAYTHRLELGRLMLALGKRQAAEKYWKEVVELEPNFLPAREALARLYFQSGRMETAWQQYQEIEARQQKLGTRLSSPLERSFLRVDTPALKTLLVRKAPAT